MVEILLKFKYNEFRRISELIKECNLVRIITDGEYIVFVCDTDNFNEINYLINLF